jgi:hypothetical protein
MENAAADTHEQMNWQGNVRASIFYFPISIFRSEEGL